METDNQFATVAMLIGEPARALMLWSLLDGKAYTAGELALVANISPQSASNHLNKLADENFVAAERQGRHRYYRFARPEVAYAIEAIANLIPAGVIKKNERPFTNGDMQYCRTCYDHLAGKIAVDLTGSLLKQKILIHEGDCFTVSPDGENWFGRIGLDLNEIKKSRRQFAITCLDWTERKHHIAGALGAALLNKMESLGWIRKKTNSRIVILTTKGEIELQRLGI